MGVIHSEGLNEEECGIVEFFRVGEWMWKCGEEVGWQLTWHRNADFFDRRVIFFVQLKLSLDIMTLDLFGVELFDEDFFLVHGRGWGEMEGGGEWKG